jgi:peptide/nickel transport system substrate-binding protein
MLAAHPGIAAELTVGLSASPTSVDPQFYVVGPNSAVARNIFDSLVNQDEHQRLQPALALSWTIVNDTTWTFKLRPGVTFHDGTPFTAADVVTSIARVPLAARGSPSSFAAYVQDIASVEPLDDLTLQIRTTRPSPLLLNNLSRIAILPASSKALTTAELNAGHGVIGTGPFKFKFWSPDDRVVLARNPAYWGRFPEWDQVQFRIIKNDTARIAGLLTGELDVIENVPSTDVKILQARKDVTIASVASNRVIYLAMDQNRVTSPFAAGPDGGNPLRKVEVRRAISLALNRQGIVDRVMDGQGVPAGQLVPDGYVGQAPGLVADPYDLASARKLLAAAGYPQGFKLTFHAPNDRYPNDAKIAQAVGQMLTRVGIKTEIDTMPGSVYFARASQREFSFMMGGAAVETGEASGVLGPLLATFGPSAGQGNRGRYSSPAFDAALGQALITLDPGKREAALQQAMRIGMQEAGVVPVLFLVNSWGLKAGLSIQARADGYTLAADVRTR